MIIYGWKSVNKTDNIGTFFCPDCSKKKSYKLISVRRFFTLYFIPIIPLNKLGSYVECHSCRGTYKPHILSQSKQMQRDHQQMEKFQAEYIEAVKNIMLLIMMADGVMDDEEIKQVMLIYHRLTGKMIDAQTIQIEGPQINYKGTIEQYIASVAPLLNMDGRIIVLQAALEVASADGVFQIEEQVLIRKLIWMLEIPKKQANLVVTQYFDVDLDLLKFACPSCKHLTAIKASAKPMGKKKKCKGCAVVYDLNKETFRVPKIAEVETLAKEERDDVSPEQCAACGHKVRLKSNLPKEKRTCIYCGHKLFK